MIYHDISSAFQTSQTRGAEILEEQELMWLVSRDLELLQHETLQPAGAMREERAADYTELSGRT